MRACTALLLPVALLLAACGQKGELYIPSSERAEAVATVPADATLPATPEEDGEEEAPGQAPPRQ